MKVSHIGKVVEKTIKVSHTPDNLQCRNKKRFILWKERFQRILSYSNVRSSLSTEEHKSQKIDQPFLCHRISAYVCAQV